MQPIPCLDSRCRPSQGGSRSCSNGCMRVSAVPCKLRLPCQLASFADAVATRVSSNLAAQCSECRSAHLYRLGGMVEIVCKLGIQVVLHQHINFEEIAQRFT
jgi:hypothetical protein